MANGSIFGFSYKGQIGYELLDAQLGNSDGVWCDISWVKSASLVCAGLEGGGGSVQIHISLSKDPPGDAVAGDVILTLTSASTAIQFLSAFLPVRWIKAKKVAGGTPTETTVLFWGLDR